MSLQHNSAMRARQEAAAHIVIQLPHGVLLRLNGQAAGTALWNTQWSLHWGFYGTLMLNPGFENT